MKHSKLGIISFVCLLYPAFLYVFVFLFGGFITRIINSKIFGLFTDVSVTLTFFLALVLSIIDLKQPDRKRILPIIVLGCYGGFFVIGIIFILLDLKILVF